jgi:hypothetical protein
MQALGYIFGESDEASLTSREQARVVRSRDRKSQAGPLWQPQAAMSDWNFFGVAQLRPVTQWRRPVDFHLPDRGIRTWLSWTTPQSAGGSITHVRISFV